MTSEGKAPLLRAIEAKLCKAKAEPGEGSAVVKAFEHPLPSPSKRLATEYEKKIKGMTGDTSLVKDFKIKILFDVICEIGMMIDCDCAFTWT